MDASDTVFVLRQENDALKEKIQILEKQLEVALKMVSYSFCMQTKKGALQEIITSINLFELYTQTCVRQPLKYALFFPFLQTTENASRTEYSGVSQSLFFAECT